MRGQPDSMLGPVVLLILIMMAVVTALHSGLRHAEDAGWIDRVGGER
jgi:fumarate reductase subunit D